MSVLQNTRFALSPVSTIGVQAGTNSNPNATENTSVSTIDDNTSPDETSSNTAHKIHPLAISRTISRSQTNRFPYVAQSTKIPSEVSKARGKPRGFDYWQSDLHLFRNPNRGSDPGPGDLVIHSCSVGAALDVRVPN